MTVKVDVDRERLESLFEANAPAVLAYLARRVAQVEDAADLLSETMLVAWKRVARIPAEDQEARMWLFVTARNTLANHRRTVKRRDSLAERLRLELSAAQHVPDPAEHSADAEIVDRALGALAPELRELVTLIHWEGFNLTGAAAITGIPASTARSRYAKARALLRASVETSALAASR